MERPKLIRLDFGEFTEEPDFEFPFRVRNKADLTFCFVLFFCVLQYEKTDLDLVL